MPRRVNDEVFIAMAKALNFINPEELSMQCAHQTDWLAQWHDPALVCSGGPAIPARRKGAPF